MWSKAGPVTACSRSSRPVGCRFMSSTSGFSPATVVNSLDIGHLDLERPLLLRKQLDTLPAIRKWFLKASTEDMDGSYGINTPYLLQFKDAIVSLESTQMTRGRPTSFQRFNGNLELLIAHMTGSRSAISLYLAQNHLDDLPSGLQADLPTPSILTRLGRGDVYSSSLWMGRAPTRTPFHRDPNPNLFVQLAGRKVIRLVEPEAGLQLFERLKSDGGHASMRDEEMMNGPEMERLESAVWAHKNNVCHTVEGIEAVLDQGDALLIPLRWWHSVHGIGTGANCSVNWWFR